jgi:hypothetical protein
VLPSLHVSLADVSQGGGPPSISPPPLLPPPPLSMHTTGAGVASTGSPPELLPLVLPETLPEELLETPPELLLDPGPPSALPDVLPPHAKASTGATRRTSAKLRWATAPHDSSGGPMHRLDVVTRSTSRILQSNGRHWTG